MADDECNLNGSLRDPGSPPYGEGKRDRNLMVPSWEWALCRRGMGNATAATYWSPWDFSDLHLHRSGEGNRHPVLPSGIQGLYRKGGGGGECNRPPIPMVLSGIRGLYRGAFARVFFCVPFTAITFAMYESLKAL